MGNRKRCNPLYTLVPASDRSYCWKAWFLHLSSASKRKGSDELFRKRTDQRGAGCFFFPVRRTSCYIWSKRIYSMGLYITGICKKRCSRSDPLHPDSILLLHRWGTGWKNTASQIYGSNQQRIHQTASSVRKYNIKESNTFCRTGAGILPCWCKEILTEKRPYLHRTYTFRSNAAERTGAWRSLLWNDPSEGCFLYERCQRRIMETRRCSKDTAQRSGTCTARTCTDLCRGQYCSGSQPDYHEDTEKGGMRAWTEMSATRETVCRSQRIW